MISRLNVSRGIIALCIGFTVPEMLLIVGVVNFACNCSGYVQYGSGRCSVIVGRKDWYYHFRGRLWFLPENRFVV